jgi:hypothetical protein
MSEPIAVIIPEVPADIIEAAEKVGSWFKLHGFSRWELAGCADRNHYISLKVTARLVVAAYRQPAAYGFADVVKHVDELDNLLR